MKKRRVFKLTSNNALLLLSAVLLFGFALFPALIFFVKHFEVKKVIIVSPQKDIRGLALLNGKNLLNLDKANLQEILLRQNLKIRKLVIKKIYPDALVVIAERRSPVAEITNSSIYSPERKCPVELNYAGSEKSDSEKKPTCQLSQEESLSMYMDNEGIVYLDKFTSKASLPQVEVYNSLIIIAGRADWRLKKVAQILKQLSRNNIMVEKVSVYPQRSQLSIFFREGVNVSALLYDDPLILADSLQIILNRFRIEGKIVEKVDFSFDKPIVVFKNGE